MLSCQPRQHPFAHPSPTRRGTALMMALVIVSILAGMSVSLTTLALSRFSEQERRQSEVELLAAAESAANEAMDWLHSYSDDSLKLMTVTSYPGSTGASWPAALNSESMPASMSAIPQMFPVLGTSTNPNYEHRAKYRNNCKVSCRVICLRQTLLGVTKWPDGNEKFVVFATAESGNLATNPERYRRVRVEAVIGTSTDHIFTRAMYGRNSYDVGGTAGTDSYIGPGAYTGVSTHHGDIASGGTISMSGSATIDGARQNNIKMTLPILTYSPTPAASSGTITGDITLYGGNNYHYTAVNMSSSDEIYVRGSGVATLYVDTYIKVKHIEYPAVNADGTPNTARLVIKQNNYTPATGDTEFDLNGGAVIGDLNNTQRLIFQSNYTGEMKLNGNGKFSGVIYAPYVDLKMNGTFNLYGSIVAEGFSGSVNGTFNFHYDESLASLSLGIPPVLTAEGWNIRALSINQQ
jgi:hypothetical protein